MADGSSSHDDEGQRFTVVLLAGEWVYSNGGTWDFVMKTSWLPRIANIHDRMSVAQLVSVVGRVFGVNDVRHELSFSSTEALLGEQNQNPHPIIIQTEGDVKEFYEKLRRGHIANLMVRLEGLTPNVAMGNGETDQLVGGTRGTAEKYGTEALNPAAGTASAQHVRVDGVNVQINPTDLSSIIRLADAATPASDSISSGSSNTYMVSGQKRRHGELGDNAQAQRTPRPTTSQANTVTYINNSDVFTPVNQMVECMLPATLREEVTGVDDGWPHGPIPPAPLRGRLIREIGQSSNWGSNMNHVCEQSVAHELQQRTQQRTPDRRSADFFRQSNRGTLAPRNLTYEFDRIDGERRLQTYDGDPSFDEANDLVVYRTGVILADDDLQVGAVYKNKSEFQTAIALYAIKRRFSYVPQKSDKRRVIYKCEDTDCPWRVFAVRVDANSDHFELRTLNLRHTCSVSARTNFPKKATSKVIADVLTSRFTNGKAGPRASQIPEMMLAELKVAISYNKGWRAKEQAILNIRGSEEEQYRLLATNMHLLQQANPGTIYTLVGKPGRNGQQMFRYLFLSLGASIAGMQYLRKVIVIDGTQLRSKFKGCLMSACMQDGNFQIFPIAFAIVDSENESSWRWFFSQLKQIAPDEPDLVIVSDRHPSIYCTITAEYPKAFHGACAVHLERNVLKHFKGKGLDFLVRKAARAYTNGEFKYWYAEIRRRSPGCADYLDNIPLEHWTQAYCKVKRYNIMSSNICESWNHALEKAIQKPIVGMVDDIRLKLMEWFCIRRAEAERMTHRLTDNANLKLIEHQEQSAGMMAIQSSPFGFQVEQEDGKNYYVDLVHKKCKCNKFSHLDLPCSHAFAAARALSLDPTTLGDDVYTVSGFANTYREIIYPIPNIEDEEVPSDVEENQFVPGTEARGSGRPRKRRVRSTAEQMIGRGTRKCSTCGETGHNRATCRGPSRN